MILDGKALSKKINDQLKEEVGALIEKTNIIPRTAIVLVGENMPAMYMLEIGTSRKSCWNRCESHQIG